ncbi:hypothetical protein ACFYNZ_04425 [Streptomyces kebangsaanensis]|uniref:Uncharacterized protein n=1 Tax=Streptomyces kebangsaanensis TaxID=864058 RepID=A0ABW6KQC5_9ACTN
MTTSGPEPAPAPSPGTAARDTARDRVGIVMGHEGPYLQLRPLSGGPEWDVDLADIRPVNPAELLRAQVAEANARSRQALREREV